MFHIFVHQSSTFLKTIFAYIIFLVNVKSTKMAFNMDMAARSYRNLTLSFRGSERQSPNCLQLALRFSRIMELRAVEGAHLASASTEDRLREIVGEFHQSPGLNAKHRLDEEKFRSVLNMITGTCPDPYCWN